MNKKIFIVSVVLVLCLIGEACFINYFRNNNAKVSEISVNLSDLTYGDNSSSLKVYSQDDYESFLSDFNSGKLPEVYVTEFIFDGVGMYKAYDLDDFIEAGNYIDVDVFKTKAININTTGNINLSGEFKGIVLVNSNDIESDINIKLNGVNIDSDSKKIPAFYVYNKDVSFSQYDVTISAVEGTKNYITGGKFKKVSLVGSDQLDTFSDKYSGDTSSWYSDYSNYYGIYTSEQINNVLFAKVTASSEDLADGDPYYFYKGAGAISSDIDLSFKGAGYLEVRSKNKEGIESKGNLTFSGGIGDYVVYAFDDCLNTTTKSSVRGARNDLVIDVNSLTAIVDLESDEGDAIDSNGSLTINGGTIIALAKTGQDSGLDADKGTFINGGTVIASGDMYDEISSESKQSFIGLGFSNSVNSGEFITLVNDTDDVIFSFKTDRNYSNLIYSSSKLMTGNYYLYKNGDVVGTDVNGFYSNADSFSDGISLVYTINGLGMMNGGNRPDGEGNGLGMPNDMQGMTPPDMNMQSDFNTLESANNVFKIDGISNLFGGIVVYSE